MRDLIENRISSLLENNLDPVYSVIKKTIWEAVMRGESPSNRTAQDIVKKHKVSMGDVMHQLEIGSKIEMNKVDDLEYAREIAMDNLWDSPSYYTEEELEEANPIIAGDKIPRGHFSRNIGIVSW